MSLLSLVLGVLLLPLTVSAGSITVLVTHPPDADLEGCRLFYGTAPGVYDTEIDIGRATSAVIDGLVPAQTYYVVGTAYDHAGNASVFSNEVVKVASADTPGDTTPPVVAITSPTEGSTVRRRSRVIISATAFDEGGLAEVTIEVWRDGVVMHACLDLVAPPYTCAWLVPSGSRRTYVLRAWAQDLSGNLGVSSEVTVTSR